MDFDYIVIGSGAGGSVMANRLSEDPRNQVLLLEYGGTDVNPLHCVPKGFFYTLRGERYAYHYPTQPVGPGGQIEYWTRGKVLGGSTTVNGMMWMRGFRADFDSLEALGNPGWGWDRVLAAYKAMEDHNLGGSELRGTGGPYGVSVVENDDEVVQALLQASQSYGWAHVDDVNSFDSERIGFTPSSIKKGVRTSAFSAFVRPVRNRANLTIQTRTRAGYLLFDGSRVGGVRVRRDGKTVDYVARKEVIVACGTVETPLLLERSGIGNANVLNAAGIEVRVESPNVGELVIEQRGAPLQVRLKHTIGPTREFNTLPKQGWGGLKYLLTRRGPLSTGGYDLVCQFKSSPTLGRPDIQGVIVPMALDLDSENLKLAKHSGIMFMGYQIRPTTTGSVHVSGSIPTDFPVIKARFLEDEHDRDATAPILDIAREVFAQDPIAGYLSDEEFPGPAVSTRDEKLRHSLDTGSGIFHAVGSAAMGPNDDDVVDSQLRVRGIEGLRIVDASIIPMQVSGNTAAPVMAAAWLAADAILTDN